MIGDVTVSRDMVAPPVVVWALISDLARMPEWSPENERIDWLGGATTAALGTKFRGTNRNGRKTWRSVGEITVFEPDRALAFTIKAGPFKVSEWRYTIEAIEGGSRVTETWTDRRSRVVRTLSTFVTGVNNRPTHNREGMEETLRRLGAATQTSPTNLTRPRRPADRGN